MTSGTGGESTVPRRAHIGGMNVLQGEARGFVTSARIGPPSRPRFDSMGQLICKSNDQ